MYLQGECPDYRFTYDSLAPSPAKLLKFLSERLPAALLPAHPGLELRDFYKAPADGSWPRPLAPPRLRGAPAASAAAAALPWRRPLSPIATALAMLPAEAAGRATNRALKAHTMVTHPYKRFPVQELASAADALPCAAFLLDATELTRLGCSVVLASREWDPPVGQPRAQCSFGPYVRSYNGEPAVTSCKLQAFKVSKKAARGLGAKAKLVAIDWCDQGCFPHRAAQAARRHLERVLAPQEPDACCRRASANGQAAGTALAPKEAHGSTSHKTCVPRNALTPGTLFMLEVSASLRAWAAATLTSPRWCNKLAIEVSVATVEGEGEMKILGRLARPWQDGSTKDTHVIFGTDADLVLMSLALPVGPRLYVLGDAPAHLRRNGIAVDPHVFSVGKLHKMWTRTLLLPGVACCGRLQLIGYETQPDAELLLGLGCDLVLPTVMSSGNVYLPGLNPRIKDLWAAQTRAWRAWSPNAHNSDHPGIVRPGGRGGKGGAPVISVRALRALLTAADVKDAEGFWSESDGDDVAAGAGVASRDPRGYLHGLAWLAHMYLQLAAPTGAFSAGRLVVAAAVPAEHALSPIAAALAMLPSSSCSAQLLPPPAAAWLLATGAPPRGSGGMQLPPALSHLYATCSDCATLKEKKNAAANRMAKARGPKANRLLSSYIPGPDVPAAEAAGRATIRALREHTADAHPYERFPVQELANAANALPHAAFSTDVRVLTRLGCSVVLASSEWDPPAEQPRAQCVPGPDARTYEGAPSVTLCELQAFKVSEPAARGPGSKARLVAKSSWGN
ncbi:hypothetical protein FOA52_013017 [Chlamydomonas sp. UWO 241]|nr:hypothetical protein FOA52_013017 [Chlamydomonas sp. UWO 241]